MGRRGHVTVCIVSLGIGLGFGIAAATASPRCTQAFARGDLLPEPSGELRVARTYALRQARTAAAPLRLGYLYVASNGATYYQAETSEVSEPERAAEIDWLRAAGFGRLLAFQYTHLAEIPAVPRIRGALALARRLHVTAVPCPYMGHGSAAAISGPRTS